MKPILIEQRKLLMPLKLNKCQAGHTSHEIKAVETAIGSMVIWDHTRYMDFPGYCTGQDATSGVLAVEPHWELVLFPRVNKILELGNKDDLVIDCGSHIGWYSKLARNHGYDVIAFEGDLENVKMTELNAPGVDARQIWFDEDMGEPFESDRNIEFLKLDIEGAEQYAIKYLQKVLPRTKNIMMEVSPTFNDSYPALLDSLKDMFEITYSDGKPFDFKYDFTQTDLFLRRKND